MYILNFWHSPCSTEIECDQRPLSSPPGTGGKPLPSPNSRFRSSQWSSSSVVTTSGTGNTCILQPRSQHKSSRGERRLEKTSTLPCTANPPLITSKVPPSTSSTSPTTTAPKSYSVDATTGHKLSPTRAKKAESTRPSPTSTSLRRNQRRRRSLSLCESFSDGESTDGEYQYLEQFDLVVVMAFRENMWQCGKDRVSKIGDFTVENLEFPFCYGGNKTVSRPLQLRTRIEKRIFTSGWLFPLISLLGHTWIFQLTLQISVCATKRLSP